MQIVYFRDEYDTDFLGVFDDDQDDLIEEMIKNEIECDRTFYPNNPARHRQKRLYYYIEDVTYLGNGKELE